MPVLADVALKAQRRTPEIAPNAAGKIDYYCVAEEATVAKLHDHGLDVVRLRDGWYADDIGGGIVILGHGRFLEVRDTPFTVKETVGPAETITPPEPTSGKSTFAAQSSASGDLWVQLRYRSTRLGRNDTLDRHELNGPECSFDASLRPGGI